MKFKLRYYVCCLLLLTSSLAQGQIQCCPGELGIGAEWLYMLPGYDLPYFAGIADIQPTITNVRRVRSEQTWQSGYRLEGMYGLCNCLDAILLRWTHFPTFSHSKDVQGAIIPLLLPLVQDPLATEGTIKDTLKFYYLDALLGWKAIECCPFTLNLQGGLQYSHLKFKEDVLFTANGELFEAFNINSCFWGIGPEIGADFNYCFWKCFSLIGRSYVALLASKREVTSLTSLVAEQSTNLKDPDDWNLVPFANIRFGVNYIKPFYCSSNLNIEVGYEGNWLFNSINRPSLAIAGDVAIYSDELLTFSLHGPYIHVGVIF